LREVDWGTKAECALSQLYLLQKKEADGACSGISLKLADHTFLFVNSHLAAHTGRNSARIANISKIKAELRLDCFLPKDDPRVAADGEYALLAGRYLI
jgi:hypothetical protein